MACFDIIPTVGKIFILIEVRIGFQLRSRCSLLADEDGYLNLDLAEDIRFPVGGESAIILITGKNEINFTPFLSYSHVKT